jgi:hypothetical protein
MNNKKQTFWRFLSDYRIEIPIIQRDYAQGRKGKEGLRISFLRDLNSALCTNEEMELDFVYGTNDDDCFTPLDGQQRLTTLWLLHWYIAYRLGKLGEDSDTSCILSKFTYETRVSSREFCKRLVVFNKEPDKISISAFIQKQTWFCSSWRHDPTIDAMLNMLSGTSENNDGIEKLFKKSSEDTLKKYWDSLTGDSCPIVFYYLDLRGLKQPDDIYIKMNARGEQLTSFENFKADFIGYINKQVREDPDHNWKKLLDAKDGIPIKMDTTWTNLFWKYRSSDFQIDDIYFAFINRFFFNELFIAKQDEEFLLDVGTGDGDCSSKDCVKAYRYLIDSDHPNNFDTKIAYQGFDVYQYYNGNIPLSFFENLQLVLDRYCNFVNDFQPISKCLWDDSFSFIPKYEKVDDKEVEIENNARTIIKKVTHLTQVQRVVFFAISKYCEEGDYDKISFSRWMRVVWNLVSGEDRNGSPQIRTFSAMREAIGYIGELRSHEVYQSLRGHGLPQKEDDFGLRFKEEIQKATKIINEHDDLRQYDNTHTWEEVLITAETNPFFKGSVRFLFTDSDGKENWDNFGKKLDHAQQYFDRGTLSDCKLLQVLLSKITIDDNLWFSNSQKFWHYVLLNKGYCEAISYILTEGKDRIEVSSDGNNDWLNLLQAVISKCEGDWHILSDWRGYKVLTQYSYRQARNVNHPEQIVVLNHPWSKLLREFPSDQRVPDTSYYYGWDIVFKYLNQQFEWSVESIDVQRIYLLDENADMSLTRNRCINIGEQLEQVVSLEDVLKPLLRSTQVLSSS